MPFSNLLFAVPGNSGTLCSVCTQVRNRQTSYLACMALSAVFPKKIYPLQEKETNMSKTASTLLIGSIIIKIRGDSIGGFG